ncbi:MAG: ABC transporter ATP-binding protein [Chloroflexi bacterium]|nr:ABC transporter ATP-binding protein [Chloroflexota bacterium]
MPAESAGQPKIVISGVAKVYVDPRTGAEVEALCPVNLSIRAGEFVCIVGPSGCGKTTLLNCIAGLVAPTAGEILVDGRPIGGPGRNRGMVFQEYGLFPWLTVEGNIQFGPKMRGTPLRELVAVSARYAKLVGLSGWEHRFPSELSGGMKQRVGIARALANQPDVLLMDEPFGALDAMTRDRMQDELLGILRADRKTCVFVTHSIPEAVFLADRIVVMTARPGRIKGLFGVPIPHRRDRASPEFAALYRTVDTLLRDEAVEDRA